MPTPVDPTTPSGGKPPRQESLDAMVIDLRKRVEALERALARISAAPGSHGGGEGLVLATGVIDANGVPQGVFLTVDASGTPHWNLGPIH